MTKQDLMIVKNLEKDEKGGDGEIVQKTDDFIKYLDYRNDSQITFHFDKSITRDHIKSLFLYEESDDLDIDMLTDAIMQAYAEDLPNALRVTRKIIIMTKENGNRLFKKFFEDGDIDEPEWDIFYSYEDDIEPYLGKSLFQYQTACINLSALRSVAKELEDELSTYDKEFEIGLISTVIHELRHIMMDCNFLLDEEKYPTNLASEESVEDFCRAKMDERLYGIKR